MPIVSREPCGLRRCKSPCSKEEGRLSFNDKLVLSSFPSTIKARFIISHFLVVFVTGLPIDRSQLPVIVDVAS